MYIEQLFSVEFHLGILQFGGKFHLCNLFNLWLSMH